MAEWIELNISKNISKPLYIYTTFKILTNMEVTETNLHISNLWL